MTQYGSIYRFDRVADIYSQNFPNAINTEGFPNAILKAGEKFESITVFRFKVF